MRLFFREISCEGRERIPTDGAGLVVSWHPNGLIDPALILAYFPGKIVFGARHGLFAWPALGWLMRRVGTVPIYRAADRSRMSLEERRKANQASLDALARELASGSYSALFPEGLSHDQPHLAKLKTGAARLYYRARELTPAHESPPVIVPVGLHYDRKNVFRSRVLITFCDPINLPADLDVRPSDEETEGERHSRYRRLTQEIERTLVEVVRATDNWALHRLMHRARELMRAERAVRAEAHPDRPSISERDLGFARIWYAYRERSQSHPAAMEALERDVSDYDRRMRAIGLRDHELVRNPRLVSPALLGLLALQVVAVYLVLPPILFVGYLVSGPPYLLLKRLARAFSKADKDAATIKVLGGAVLFPVAWGLAAYLAARAHSRLHLAFPSIPDVPVVVAVLTVILGILGGLLALRYNELARQTLHAVRVRVTRRRRKRTVEHLLETRSRLYEEFVRLGEGLHLPGAVAADGTIVSNPEGYPRS